MLPIRFNSIIRYFCCFCLLFFYRNGSCNSIARSHAMIQKNGFYRIRNPETTTDLQPWKLRNNARILLLQNVFGKWKQWESTTNPIYKMFAIEKNNSSYFLQLYRNRTLLIVESSPPTGPVPLHDSRMFKVVTHVHSYFSTFQHVKSRLYVVPKGRRGILSESRDPSLAVNLEIELSSRHH